MKTLVEGLQLGLRSSEGDHNDRKDILARYLCHHKDVLKLNLNIYRNTLCLNYV